jgi:hypothetical protein
MNKLTSYLLIGAMTIGGCKKQAPEQASSPINRTANISKTLEKQERISGIYSTKTSGAGQLDERLILADGRDFYKIKGSGEGITASWNANIDLTPHKEYDEVFDEIVFSKDGKLVYTREYCQSYIEKHSEYNVISSGTRLVKSEKHQGRWSQNGNTIDIILDE